MSHSIYSRSKNLLKIDLRIYQTTYIFGKSPWEADPQAVAVESRCLRLISSRTSHSRRIRVTLTQLIRHSRHPNTLAKETSSLFTCKSCPEPNCLISLLYRALKLLQNFKSHFSKDKALQRAESEGGGVEIIYIIVINLLWGPFLSFLVLNININIDSIYTKKYKISKRKTYFLFLTV